MRLAVVLLALLVCAPVRAQVETAVGEVCRLPVDAPEAAQAPAAARRGAASALAACPPAERTARFEVEYVGFPDAARAAFQAAVDVWACRVATPLPIRVRASWESLPASTLGSAGPVLYRNFSGAPARDTWYPAALASVYAGRDLDTSQPDIVAHFNSSFQAWHRDPTTPPPADRYDLATVVLHELAHGLGFIGALTVEHGLGSAGASESSRGPYVYDRHAEDGAGVLLLDSRVYPDRSAALSAALRSGAVFFDGPAVRQASARAELYAPGAWNEGSSYSHLDEAAFAPSTPDGLMTPFLARGERIDEPGTTVCAVLADIGWTLAGDCAARVGPVASVLASLTVQRTGPNPFRLRTSLRVWPASAGPVRATLVDASGRLVGRLFDRTVAAGEPVDIRIEASGLAAGAYFVLVNGGGDERLVSVVVVR